MAQESRSLLFVPGDRPERFEKAAAAGAHEVVIDLEDAVAPDNKVAARLAIADWLQGDRAVGIRINAMDTPWFEDDLAMAMSLPSATIMVAKADAVAVARVAGALPGRGIIPLLETVSGYMALRQMATTAGVRRIAFGSIDFGVDSGIADEGDAMTAVRTSIVLESRFAGLQAPVDGVSVNFKDEELMMRDALRSRQLGFGGKLCIHPRQVALVNSAYRPTAEQLDWARRVVAAAEASNGGATTVDGKMVDRPVVIEAERIIAEAAR